jgi:hypothetical protein
MAIAYCLRTGAIEVADKCPETGLYLARGCAGALRTGIEGTARLAYDGATWLVPGIPEAEDGFAAIDAALAYSRRLVASVARQNAA